MSTFNYDIENNKLLSLQDIMRLNNINEEEAAIKIKAEIQSKQSQYGFQRNPTDEIYEIANTNTFFLGENNYLYVLYPYGNNNFTNEVDVIIF
jgi:DUF2075 family protein